MTNPTRTARFIGLLYLAVALLGPMAYLIPRSGVVPGDTEATMRWLTESETLVRWGMVSEGLVVVVEVVLTAFLFYLVRPVSRGWALSAAFARLGMTVIQGSNLVISALLLSVVGGAGFLSAFTANQVDGLGMLFLDASSFGVLVWGILFGLHLGVLAWLVYRSGFLPRWIGILLGLASFGYLAQSLGVIIAPDAADVLETVVLISLPGELSLMFWLLIKGVDDDAWLALDSQAAVAGSRSTVSASRVAMSPTGPAA